MKTKSLLSLVILLSTFNSVIIPLPAQTAKPAPTAHQPTSDTAERKALAAMMADFKNSPDADLRGRIIELAKSLKPAPLVPLAAKADFSKAIAQIKTATTPDDFKAAAQLLERAGTEAPWYADAYLNAATAYSKAADYDSAKRNLTLYFTAARAGVDTSKGDQLQREMEEQLAAKQQQQALAQFRQTLAQFKANPNDSTRAEIIRLALALPAMPELPESVHDLAGRGTYGVKNASSDADFLAASDAYAKALQIAPWVADYYFNQGVAYEKARHFDDAIAAFNWYLLAAPNAKDAPAVHERIGGLKFAKEKAERDRQDAIRAEQQRQEAHNRQCNQFVQDVNNGNAAYQGHRYEDAIDLFNKSLRDGCPEHAEAGMVYAGLAAAYADKGNTQEGLNIARKGLDLYPNYPNIHGILGNLLWVSGDRNGACQHWRTACNLGFSMGCSTLRQYAPYSPYCQ
jgi:tetratricopeptide (TPR) repeat protein